MSVEGSIPSSDIRVAQLVRALHQFSWFESFLILRGKIEPVKIPEYVSVSLKLITCKNDYLKIAQKQLAGIGFYLNCQITSFISNQ